MNESLSSDLSEPSCLPDLPMVDPFIDYSWTSVSECIGTVDALYSHLDQSQKLNIDRNISLSVTKGGSVGTHYSVMEALKSSPPKDAESMRRRAEATLPSPRTAGRSVFFANMRTEKLKTKRFVEILSRNSPLKDSAAPPGKLAIPDPYDFDGAYASSALDSQRGGKFHSLFLRRRYSQR